MRRKSAFFAGQVGCEGCDGLPSSLLISPESPIHFHKTNPCFLTLCAEERQQKFSGWLISGSPTKCQAWD